MSRVDDKYLGIDPGKKGAMSIVDSDGAYVESMRLCEPLQVVQAWLREHAPSIKFAMLERVWAKGGEGAVGAFSFGVSFGACEALLAAFEIPHELVLPLKWQRSMGVPKPPKKATKTQKKNAIKQVALRLWPKAKITLIECDAMLIAEYCRRTRLGIGG